MPRRPSRRRRVFAIEPLELRQMMNADSQVLDLLIYDSWRGRAATIHETTIVPPSGVASSAMSYDLWRSQSFSLGEIAPQEVGASTDPGASAGELGTYDAQAWNLIRLNEVRSNYSYTGAGYTVAVIDTGIDYNHPALGGGWGNRVIAGWDFVNNDSNPMDDNGHGTHVAGIIASSNATYSGIAPNVNLVALKVLGADGSGNFGAVEDALRWVINNQAQYNIVAVNMSLGAGNFPTNPYTFLEDEFATLTSQGVFIAAASGNSYYSYGSQQGLGYPAISNLTVSVGAVYDANVGSVTWSSGARDYTTAADRITSFTQRNSSLNILAPGAMITSTGRNNTYVTMAGTSMATPVVAGAAVLIHQALDANGLSAAAFQSYILNLMRLTGASVVDGDDENDNVVNTGLSFKRLDLFAALTSISNTTNSPNLGSGIGVFDPSRATFYLRSTATAGFADGGIITFGGPGWTPLLGDWNGDGVDTIGVYNPGTSTFYLRNSNTPGSPDSGVVHFGGAGWVPLVGDWDGDGVDTIGVYNPWTSTFYLRNSNTPGPPDAGVVNFGGAGWVPLVGDWDGDGVDTIGVYNPWTSTFYLRNSNTPGPPDAGVISYGGSGWTPCVGDWDGDGVTTIGVRNPWSGVFYLRNSNSGGPADAGMIGYGAPGWKGISWKAGVFGGGILTGIATGQGTPSNQDMAAAAKESLDVGAIALQERGVTRLAASWEPLRTPAQIAKYEVKLQVFPSRASNPGSDVPGSPAGDLVPIEECDADTFENFREPKRDACSIPSTPWHAIDEVFSSADDYLGLDAMTIAP